MLTAAGVVTLIVLHQRTESWWTDGVLFRADFHLPARPGHRADKEDILHVTCRSAPAAEKEAARTFLEEDVLPAFVNWIRNLEQLPDNSTRRREKPSFTRVWEPRLDGS
jgi:hypothetical protein